VTQDASLMISNVELGCKLVWKLGKKFVMFVYVTGTV
jgi:hypothetical protein